MKLITNNPKVLEKFSGKFKIEYINGDYEKVLLEARNQIHKGTLLLIHPLYGSVKPNETPYRTLLLEENHQSLDQKSLLLIEEALSTFKKFSDNIIKKDWQESVILDFQVVDLDLTENTLKTQNWI